MRSERLVMIAPKRRTPRQSDNRPTPTFWGNNNRNGRESALDTETTITLACHLGRVFDNATSWDQLVFDLRDRGFSLRFEDTRLALVNEANGTSLCTCAALGRNFASLTERLGKPRVKADTARITPMMRLAAE